MGVQSKARIERISIEDVQESMKDLVFIDARSATGAVSKPAANTRAIHLSVKEVKSGLAHVQENHALIKMGFPAVSIPH